jgi:hypothetical protein
MFQRFNKNNLKPGHLFNTHPVIVLQFDYIT